MAQRLHKKAYQRIIIFVIFAICIVRLAWLVIVFGQTSLQMDFSAYYTAGESVNNRLSPYKNYILRSPPIWDGKATYPSSRFLYPPLAANFFQIIAKLPYYYAKYLWMVFSLICLAASMYIAIRVIFSNSRPEILGLSGILACLFYPLFALIERGQIDCLTLLLITSAIAMIVSERSKILAGIIFSLAALFKLHVIAVIPFMVLHRQWKVVAGYAAGILLIITLTVLLNGWGLSLGYVFDELPRITKYGESTPTEKDLLTEIDGAIQKFLKNTPNAEIFTIKDGREYMYGHLIFCRRATIVKTEAASILKRLGKIFGLELNMTAISMIFFGLFFGLIFAWQKISGFNWQKATRFDKFVYWQAVLVIILLCAPLTWVMNTVWLLPVGFVFIHQCIFLQSKTQVLLLCLIASGLLAAALPDRIVYRMFVASGAQFLRHRSVISELLIFIGLLGTLENNRRMQITSRNAGAEKAITSYE